MAKPHPTTVRLTATTRTDFGKGAARQLRRDGFIPAVMYGDGSAVTHVALNAHDLTLALATPKVTLEIDLDGKVTTTKARDVQRDPVRRTIEHIDLIVLSAAEARVRDAAATEIADAADAEQS